MELHLGMEITFVISRHLLSPLYPHPTLHLSFFISASFSISLIKSPAPNHRAGSFTKTSSKKLVSPSPKQTPTVTRRTQ
jgi:hypothetical protein